jgi:hypothetical protein
MHSEVVMENNPEVSPTQVEENTEFTRANIETNQKIHLVDTDEEVGLDLFCYTRCSNEDSEFVKNCRGVVFHGDQLVMKAFPYTPEYPVTDADTIRSLMTDFNEWSAYEAFEGALIRLFHFSGRWFLSTHRKLNAFRSKWASRDSFGTLFKRALESQLTENKDFAHRLQNQGENVLDQFQNTLDPSMQYMFLLRNNSDNRIVCTPPSHPTVYHVGTFVNGKLDMNISVDIEFPRKMNFDSLDDLLTFVGKSTNPMHSQGVICFGPDGKQVKVLNPTYHELFKARGNEPSIKFRYLQVRMNKKLVEMLYYLYPEMAPVFNGYENTIYDVANSILRSYIQRFIKHNYITVPHQEFQVMRECHDWYLSDRQNNRVTLERVITVLNKQPATNLNHMIRNFKLEEAKKQTTHPRSQDCSPVVNAESPAMTLLTLKRIDPPKLNV